MLITGAACCLGRVCPKTLRKAVVNVLMQRNLIYFDAVLVGWLAARAWRALLRSAANG